jgi:hypothetical protein
MPVEPELQFEPEPVASYDLSAKVLNIIKHRASRSSASSATRNTPCSASNGREHERDEGAERSAPFLLPLVGIGVGSSTVRIAAPARVSASSSSSSSTAPCGRLSRRSSP